MWGDELRNTLVPIGKMWTDPDFFIATDLHTHERVLDAGNRLAPTQHNRMIDERHPILYPHHLAWEMLGLLHVDGNFLAFIEEDSGVVEETISFLRRFPFSLPLIEKLNTR